MLRKKLISQAIYSLFGFFACLDVQEGMAGQSDFEPTPVQAEALSQVHPKDYPGLPHNVRSELEKRSCMIPQSYLNDNVHNAVLGQLMKPDQLDWAVICLRDKEFFLLVFPSGSRSSEMVGSPWTDYVHIEKYPNGRWGFGYNLKIHAVNPHTILRHYQQYGGPEPPPLNHQGLDLYCCEKASVTYFWHKGSWLKLTGAD
ncbi:MAG: hypothetical protein V7731_15445 [Amphritea sp.]